MNETVLSYSLYLTLAVALTVWVARTLHHNGRVFLVDCFHGNSELADSVNHLLLVGFYLVNIGFVSLYLKTADEIIGARGVFEALSGKMGSSCWCLAPCTSSTSTSSLSCAAAPPSAACRHPYRR
jgi:hypothetical protein